MHTRTRASAIALVVVAALVGGTAGPAAAAFPQDPPNDPDYSSQTYLFDHIPPEYALASDPEGASGMFVDRAWRDYTTGRPDTVIAYIEGGINWHAGDAAELVDRVYINRGELPLPCAGPPCTTVFGGSFAAYDLNGDGTFNTADYASDPRVTDANGNGPRDPEDLIVAFSNGTDNDANGYVDDISGWDFYDNQNDPATADTAYTHANGQMKQAAAETNNGIGSAGICPNCMLLPIKAGAEALDRTDDLAEAWLFAADSGASVIVSVTADLGYSSFMKQAVESIWRRGVVMVEASNDFNSTDHQGGMWWPHVLPGNGIVANGQGAPVGEQAVTTTFRARSNYTSWGTHNMFSVAADGGTTSESTPTVGGVAALLLSHGKNAADQNLIGAPLTNAETVQVLREASDDIDDPTLPWPGKPGWDLQYGYGRPNVWEAMQRVSAGDIPPVGWIDSPDWYALYDPTTTSTVPVTGHVEASRSPSYTWQLEFAPGAEPTDGQFVTAGSGSGTAPFDGSLGSVDLATLPASFWGAAYQLSSTKTLETTEQYTVTIRIRVTDASGRIGEERRTIAVHRDSSWKSGFPKHIGPGGEAQPALVDLQGQGRLAIVFGDTDGWVHALDSQTGDELPGWPQHTDPTVVTKSHPGVSPGYEPIVSGVAVGDLKGKGKLSVVVTTTTGTVYVFKANGQRQPSWTPKALTMGIETPAIPRQQLPRERQRVRGATAPPVLADLDGDGKLEIIQAGWNGYLHAWRFDGTSLPGWPVNVDLPAGFTPPSGYVRVLDHKLVTPPAVADLDGDGRPELVIRSQLTEVTGSGITFNGHGHVFAYRADATPVPGWPNDFTTFAEYYGSAQEFITEGSSVPAVADVEGDGNDEVAVGGAFGPTFLFDGDGSVRLTYAASDEVAATFTTSGAFGNFGAGLTYAQPGTDGASLIDSLLLPGSGNPINNVERAFSARAGAPQPGFSAKLQGLDFLGGPIIADVSGDGATEVINAGDSSALHAYELGGGQAPGFPKFTTGWSLWSPTAGDLDGDGDTEVVLLTREGYLFVWNTPGLATANDEWWHTGHDERHTGRFGLDARPPGVARSVQWMGGSSKAKFLAPGDDWYTGTVAKYVITFRPSNITIEKPPKGAAGTIRKVVPPAGTTSFTVQAVDDAGNKGRSLSVTPS